MLTSSLPKDGRVVGLIVIVPRGGGGIVVAPIPLSVNTCGLLPDSLIVTVADSFPIMEGVKVTVKLQATVAGTVCPHVLKLLKSAAFGPVTTTLVIVSAAVPFARVTT